MPRPRAAGRAEPGARPARRGLRPLRGTSSV